MFPPIKYTIDTPPLSMEDSLPSHSRAMYKILRDRKIIDRNYLEKHNINNIDSLESFIFGKINNYKIESHDYQELKEIFCLIHIWGGNTGRNIFIQGGTGFNWNKISIPYEKLVIACCEIIPDSQNTLNISLELPCLDLNLINPKTPATAKEVPKFPFTNKITENTNNGKTESVNKKLGVVLLVIL